MWNKWCTNTLLVALKIRNTGQKLIHLKIKMSGSLCYVKEKRVMLNDLMIKLCICYLKFHKEKDIANEKKNWISSYLKAIIRDGIADYGSIAFDMPSLAFFI